MIECTGTGKRFGNRWAIRDVSFQMGTGICTLIGPNGAGKSTLLKMLTGLLVPDTGTIQVAGLPVTGRALALRRLIGVVPEDLGLFDSLTIEEHLEMCGPIYGLAVEETRRRMESLLRFLDLFQGRRTFLDQCSYGMRKKTALAMALLHAPRVLFLDEPFEGIDPESGRRISRLLTALPGRGITVFLTSHMLSTIEEMPCAVMMIQEGRVVWRSEETEGRAESLEEVYFRLAGSSEVDELTWLRSSQS